MIHDYPYLISYTLSDFSYPCDFRLPMRFSVTHAISESLAIPYTFRFLDMS